MRARLRHAEYLFCRFPSGKRLPEHVLALATFEDAEGTTAIVESGRAQREKLDGIGPFAMITLGDDGELPQPGAADAAVVKLAEAGIVAHAVSAYDRDHLFVASPAAQHAVDLLELISPPAAGSEAPAP